MIRVPDDLSIHSIVVMSSLSGRGSAWFEAFVLEMDGIPMTTLPGSVAAPRAGDLEALMVHASPLRPRRPVAGKVEVVYAPGSGGVGARAAVCSPA